MDSGTKTRAMRSYAPPRRTTRQVAQDSLIGLSPWIVIGSGYGGYKTGEGLGKKIIQVKENKLAKESNKVDEVGKQILAKGKQSLLDNLNVVKAKQKEILQTLFKLEQGGDTGPLSSVNERKAWLKEQAAQLHKYRLSLEKKLGIGNTSVTGGIDPHDGRIMWDIGSTEGGPKKFLSGFRKRKIMNRAMIGGTIGGLIVSSSLVRAASAQRVKERSKAKREWLAKYEKMEKSGLIKTK